MKQRLRTLFWDLTYRLGPDLVFLTLFGTALLVAMAVYGGTFSAWHASIVMPLGIAGVLAASALLARKSPVAILRDWFPLVAIVFLYENAHDLTNLVRPGIVDGALRRLDEALFSVEPALALQRVTRPWLTEYMTFAYATYFAYPTVVLWLLYRATPQETPGTTKTRSFVQFREFGLALSLCFYLGLTGYVLVPAIGPRYAFPNEFAVPLDGYWLTGPAAEAWESLQTIKRDCFPSLHTALTAVSLLYMWRYRREWRWGRLLFGLSTPLIVSLWVSTLYLRYHYAVDVVAGLALAVLCAQVSPAFVRWYYARKLGATPVVSTMLDLPEAEPLREAA